MARRYWWAIYTAVAVFLTCIVGVLRRPDGWAIYLSLFVFDLIFVGVLIKRMREKRA